ncbi:MAG: hypothetical protein H5T50_00305 [Nitrososphaeria archaeon]|nr:hypothetical protein [Nitrososphaeria archaeon]
MILTPIIFYITLSFTGSKIITAIVSLLIGVSILFIGNIFLYYKLKGRK